MWKILKELAVSTALKSLFHRLKEAGLANMLFFYCLSHCPKLIRGTRLPIFKKKETVIISHWRASNRLDDYLRIIYVICPRSSNRAKGWCQNGSRENRHWIGLGKKGKYFSDLSGFWREWGGCGGNTSSKLLIFHQNLVGCIGPQFRFGLNSFIQINA